MVHQQERFKGNVGNVEILKEKIQFRNGKVALNRLMKSPMSEKIYNWEDPSEEKRGVPNQQLVNLYEKWGFGGFGIIFLGNVVPDPKYIYEAGQGIVSRENDSSEMRNWYAKMARAAKANHSLAIAQINNPGAWALTSYTDNRGRVHKISDGVENPLEFDGEKLRSEVIGRLVYAAKLLSNCGFDGIEIMSAHGNLYSSFLLASNPRKDEYGGNRIENRARLHVEIYKYIRKEIPAASGFLIGIKINSADFQNGYSDEDIIKFCEIIETTGYDFVEITGGQMEHVIKEENQRSSTIAREDFFVKLIKMVTKVFSKTVVYITGGWQTVGGMVDAVNLGITQGIGFARASAAEPNLARKLLTGQANAVLHNKFGPSDFMTSKHAAHFQMRSAAQSSIENVQSSTDGIPDFTNEKEANHFAEKAAEYMKHVGENGKPDSFAETISYKPL
ncbi:unnamed protein product [Caenorhabditis angaria]|uniref:NADH:flavin oxidoreductase/NADH oxidase N-terminal domain-containing protein n=1 Tax=Caenorhabditis angaria TaxID=860376 RepID=A0A9P1ITS9_9PELO|nr:unnamed protein product [Caenorhabditis angaria]